MRGTAVQFGAGNIGRGFVAQLFHESGLEVAFVDVVPDVLGALRSGRYTIHIVGPGAHEVPIDSVRGVDGRDQTAVAREIASCQVACTAVGAGALRHIAPNLAAGLLLRYRQNRGPLNVIVCENLHDASSYLRALVAEHLPDTERDAVLAQTGFPQATVSRMVPLQDRWAGQGADDPLAIRVEGYKRLPVDASAVVGSLPAIVGVEPVANFQAYVDRKLYTHNCAHATLGYLGWERAIEYGYQALECAPIRLALDQVMAETSRALVSRHHFDPDEHGAHVSDILARVANAELADTCFRLARDPLRKLAPDDRLVGAARLCEAEGVVPAAIARVIASALRFYAPEDAASVELQRRIRDTGVEAVLQEVCCIDPTEPLGIRVRAEYASGPDCGGPSTERQHP